MKIEIIGKFYDNHSLSIINRNLAIGLNKKHDVIITPLDAVNSDAKVKKEHLEILDELSSKEVKLGEEAELQVRHSYPPIWRWPISDKTKVVFIQPWEWMKIPFEWQYKWEQFADGLIIPSKWLGDHILTAGLNPKKLHVVPNGYDDTVFNHEPVEKPSFIPKDTFVFTYVGCAQWRKGLDILLNAWQKVFKKADKVALVVKDTPQIYGANNVLNEITKIQYSSGCAEIIYLDDNYSAEEMAAIFKHSNAVVHPYRAEGFGMHVQEAMACGCIPIVSQFGPTDEFVGDVALKLDMARKNININSGEVFALKPGDATTMMNTYATAFEPTVDSVHRMLNKLYYSHTKEEFTKKVKNFKLENTWENVILKYESALKTILDNEGTQRGTE